MDNITWDDYEDFFIEKEAERTLRAIKKRAYADIQKKTEEMAKFLYPDAVADAFREYADAVLSGIMILDRDFSLPIMKEMMKPTVSDKGGEE